MIELERLEHEIIHSIWVKRQDELMQYFKTMMDEEVEDLLEKPFPALEGSFLAWSLRNMLGME